MSLADRIAVLSIVRRVRPVESVHAGDQVLVIPRLDVDVERAAADQLVREARTAYRRRPQ